jgi:ABC-type dipeptide/oligopeptide/nickel transport system permease subunit
MAARRGLTVALTATLAYIAILGVASFAAPALAPHGPTEQNLNQRLLPPGSQDHLLGTDDFGRDVYSRIIYGARSALLVGLVSVSIAVTIGLIVGLTSGLARGTAENILMLLMDGLLSFPTIILAITVVSVFGYGLTQVMVAVGVIFSPVFARLVRAETLAITAEGYVESAHALGTPLWRIIRLHIMPNMLPKLIVQCSIIFALAVAIEASLSFLGLGTQPPNPSWGLMLKDARNYLFQAPWLAIYPGLAIALTVLAFNLTGDALSELINPRHR